MKKLLFIFAMGLIVSLNSCGQSQVSVSDSDSVVAKPTVIVKELPVGLPVDEILQTIVDEFKDQVVVIDFWATWCPPCMAAMTQIDQIKENYLKEGLPVAFVYITGETSPKEEWAKVYPRIKGYHYRLKGKEFDGMLRSLGIRGIPTYYIADKKGKHFYDNISTGGYPGNDIISSKIDEALNRLEKTDAQKAMEEKTTTEDSEKK